MNARTRRACSKAAGIRPLSGLYGGSRDDEAAEGCKTCQHGERKSQKNERTYASSLLESGGHLAVYSESRDSERPKAARPVSMAKENRIDVKKDRGGSVSRLNLFYFVIQIIVHRNEDPVLFRDRPDCPGEDLYLRRLLPDPVLRHRGHGVRGE